MESTKKIGKVSKKELSAFENVRQTIVRSNTAEIATKLQKVGFPLTITSISNFAQIIDVHPQRLRDDVKDKGGEI